MISYLAFSQPGVKQFKNIINLQPVERFPVFTYDAVYQQT
jgi:hypothetical protein